MEVGSSSSNFKLYDQLELLEYEDRLVFKSLESPDKGFSICRRQGNIEPLSGKSFFFFLSLSLVSLLDS